MFKDLGSFCHVFSDEIASVAPTPVSRQRAVSLKVTKDFDKKTKRQQVGKCFLLVQALISQVVT